MVNFGHEQHFSLSDKPLASVKELRKMDESFSRSRCISCADSHDDDSHDDDTIFCRSVCSDEGVNIIESSGELLPLCNTAGLDFIDSSRR